MGPFPAGWELWVVTKARCGVNLPSTAPGPVVSPSGHVVDHIALSVTDLAATLERLESEGVRVLRGSQAFGSGGTSAFIEGPDAIVIELVERP